MNKFTQMWRIVSKFNKAPKTYIKFSRCVEILDQFENLTNDFTSNPLHLQMICEIEGVESLQQPDVISLYEKYVQKKIKHGLETYLQIKEDTYLFPKKLKHIYDILTKCAEARVLEKRGEIVQLEEDRNDINLSGVATVVDNKRPLEFVHLTFAEFLTAHKFIQMLFGELPKTDMGMDRVKLFVRKLFKDGVSNQTMRFVEGFFNRNKDKKFHSGVLVCIEAMKREIFERICHAGMPNLYSFLFREVFGGVKVKEWILKSQKATTTGWRFYVPKDIKMSLYFYACSSSPQLAELLSEWCPMLQVDNVDLLFVYLVIHTSISLMNLHCLEIALSRVEDWKSRWQGQISLINT